MSAFQDTLARIEVGGEAADVTLLYVGLRGCPYCSAYDADWERLQAYLEHDGLRTVRHVFAERGPDLDRAKAHLGFQTVPALVAFVPQGDGQAAGPRAHLFREADRDQARVLAWLYQHCQGALVRKAVDFARSERNVVVALTTFSDPASRRVEAGFRAVCRADLDGDHLIQPLRVLVAGRGPARQAALEAFDVRELPAVVYVDSDGRRHVRQGPRAFYGLEGTALRECMHEWLYRATFYPESLQTASRASGGGGGMDERAVPRFSADGGELNRIRMADAEGSA